jgi:hypothetical protein
MPDANADLLPWGGNGHLGVYGFFDGSFLLAEHHHRDHPWHFGESAGCVPTTPSCIETLDRILRKYESGFRATP